jgi:hypothetical protein
VKLANTQQWHPASQADLICLSISNGTSPSTSGSGSIEDDCFHQKSDEMLHPCLETVRRGWNRQSLGPRRSYPESVRISSQDGAEDEFTGAPVSPLFLPIAIPRAWYFPCSASQVAHVLTRQKVDTIGTLQTLRLSSVPEPLPS